jgi:hypothetical protein
MPERKKTSGCSFNRCPLANNQIVTLITCRICAFGGAPTVGVDGKQEILCRFRIIPET